MSVGIDNEQRKQFLQLLPKGRGEGVVLGIFIDDAFSVSIKVKNGDIAKNSYSAVCGVIAVLVPCFG